MTRQMDSSEIAEIEQIARTVDEIVQAASEQMRVYQSMMLECNCDYEAVGEGAILVLLDTHKRLDALLKQLQH